MNLIMANFIHIDKHFDFITCENTFMYANLDLFNTGEIWKKSKTVKYIF